MKILSAEIKNFRILKDSTVNLDESVTIIVGKNNTGKTSFSQLFYLFFKDSRFSIYDFSLSCQKEFIEAYRDRFNIGNNRPFPLISLELKIEYTDADNWALIRDFLVNLDNDNTLTILCEYSVKNSGLFFKALKKRLIDINASEENIMKEVERLLSTHYEKKFISKDNKGIKAQVEKLTISKLLSVDFIGAQRTIVDGSSDSKAGIALSSILEKQYKMQLEEQDSIAIELDNTLDKTSKEIDNKLESHFEGFKDSLTTFGYPGLHDSSLNIKSDIEAKKLFKDYVKLFYQDNEAELPEIYNGLGTSNLIYIIAKVYEYLVADNRDTGFKLLFIEEPEAHMHPQMQTVFIANVEDFLKRKGIKVQLVISTHSSHILYGASFDKIRYFKKDHNNSVLIKNLCDYEKEYSGKLTNTADSMNHAFLRKYLTTHKCDIFFADKLVFIEGTSERLLFPRFLEILKKEKGVENALISQHVTIFEVGGAYAHIFKHLISFLELKTLVITDIDSVESKGKHKKRKVQKNRSLITSNPILKSWIPEKESIDDLWSLSKDGKTDGFVRVAYQTPKKGKCGRSFEEAMIIENSQYFINNIKKFPSVKRALPKNKEPKSMLGNSYTIQNKINKTNFALELLFDQGNWQLPNYIKEGLRWLEK